MGPKEVSNGDVATVHRQSLPATTIVIQAMNSHPAPLQAA
jgi:hypothetical protein